MPTKLEGRPSRHDLIDDIVEAPSSSTFASNSVSSFMADGSKTMPNRTYSSYTNIPTLFSSNNNKPKLEKTASVTAATTTTTFSNDLRDRFQLNLPRSNSSSTMMSNDERRKELDLVLKHLYDGKLLTSINDDRPSSDLSEPSTPFLAKGPMTTTNTHMKREDDNQMNLGNLEVSGIPWNSCLIFLREGVILIVMMYL